MLTRSWRQPHVSVVHLDLPCWKVVGICAHLKSKRHVATTFTAAQATLHRIRHSCMRKGCSRALILASWATNRCNSCDHLPPTSMAKTTRRARLLSPALGTCVPCASWPVEAPLRPCQLFLCAATHHNAKHAPSCPTTIVTHSKWASHPRPLPICDCLRLLGQVNPDPGLERGWSLGHQPHGTLELQRSRVRNPTVPMPLFSGMMHGWPNELMRRPPAQCSWRTAVKGESDGVCCPEEVWWKLRQQLGG